MLKFSKREYDRQRYKANKKMFALKNRRVHLKKNYGLTLEDYESLLKSQNYRCAVCRKPETKKNTRNASKTRNLSVDHCHKTGKIRGLLCDDCNNLLGRAKDSKRVLRSAITYLSK